MLLASLGPPIARVALLLALSVPISMWVLVRSLTVFTNSIVIHCTQGRCERHSFQLILLARGAVLLLLLLLQLLQALPSW